jgi:hypothetical protein
MSTRPTVLINSSDEVQTAIGRRGRSPALTMMPYGAVAEWMYRYVGGVDTNAKGAGFSRILLRSNIDAHLRTLRLDCEWPYGKNPFRLESRRRKNVTWTVTIPVNAHGVFQPK